MRPFQAALPLISGALPADRPTELQVGDGRRLHRVEAVALVQRGPRLCLAVTVQEELQHRDRILERRRQRRDDVEALLDLADPLGEHHSSLSPPT